MKIALITDAWRPQVNGVVRTLTNMRNYLERQGHEVLVIDPCLFAAVPLPNYPEVRLALAPGRGVRRMLDDFDPQAIHIATEGPCGLAARRYCLRRKLPFTTSYHTQFPHYLRMYFGLPRAWGYAAMRYFHKPAVRTLVPTDSVRAELKEQGFGELQVWSRGVDTSLFHPRNGEVEAFIDQHELHRPIFLNVGRVATEKNLAAFAGLDLPGDKVIVGEGPRRRRLMKRHDDVTFTGYLPDDQLAIAYAAADVFVFPSMTDTFGNVMLESMASGTPVAAFPVTGPVDVVTHGRTGVLHEDLREAALGALQTDRDACLAYAASKSWDDIGAQLVDALEPFK
ncbi:MAG: glycosyltransferase [Phycisphaera sp.]|nr:glycosyltransferase [Phycisphaera sp.]